MKKELRREFLLKRSELTPGEVESRSKMISERVFSLAEYSGAGTVMFYLSFRNEVRTDGMIKEGLKSKKIVVPVVSGNDLAVYGISDFEGSLETGSFGIREPIEGHCSPAKHELIDLVIVPGVVCDKAGGRIGFGRGYYDRFLSRLKGVNENVSIIGIAFNMQLIERIEIEANDVRMDKVVTEDAVYGIN